MGKEAFLLVVLVGAPTTMVCASTSNSVAPSKMRKLITDRETGPEPRLLVLSPSPRREEAQGAIDQMKRIDARRAHAECE